MRKKKQYYLSTDAGTKDRSKDHHLLVGSLQRYNTIQKLQLIFLNAQTTAQLLEKMQLGGVIGSCEGNTNVTLTIANSTNNGNISGPKELGGMTGVLVTNKNMTVGVLGSANTGNISGVWKIGGFFGSLQTNTDITVSILDSVNTGITSGDNHIGGLIGLIESDSSNYVSILVRNGANKGAVSVTNEIGCGFICVYILLDYNVEMTIQNSINKGSIKAPSQGYGISNKNANAHNVVSMGEMDSTQDLYSFWPSFSYVDRLYALEGTNNNCPGVKLFHSTENGFYQLEGSTEYVGDLHSNSATERDYGMVWTRELDLGYLLMVSIGKPINTNMTMLHGYTIKEVIEKMNVDTVNFILICQFCTIMCHF